MARCCCCLDPPDARTPFVSTEWNNTWILQYSTTTSTTIKRRIKVQLARRVFVCWCWRDVVEENNPLRRQWRLQKKSEEIRKEKRKTNDMTHDTTVQRGLICCCCCCYIQKKREPSCVSLKLVVQRSTTTIIIRIKIAWKQNKEEVEEKDDENSRLTVEFNLYGSCEW